MYVFAHCNEGIFINGFSRVLLLSNLTFDAFITNNIPCLAHRVSSVRIPFFRDGEFG